MLVEALRQKLKKPERDTRYRSFWQYIHIDITLLSLLLIICMMGLVILYSASDQSIKTVELQAGHFIFAFGIMFVIAQIPPVSLQRAAPWLYFLGLFLLIVVLGVGHIGKGAQRWLNLGFMRFQPSELMKLAIPLVLAWYYHHIHLPITFKSLLISIPIILIPAFLTAKQP